MFTHSFKVSVILCVFSLAAAVASAGPVTLLVEGVVNEVILEGGFSLDGSVGSGTVMTGTCTFDPDVFNSRTESTAKYPLSDIRLNVGNYSFTDPAHSGPDAILEDYFDDYIFAAYSNAPVFEGTLYEDGQAKTYDNVDWSYTYMTLFNLWTTTYQDSIVDYFRSIDPFNLRREFGIRMYEQDPSAAWLYDGAFIINGEITSISVVPEPMSVVLFGLGIPAVLRWGRRR